MARRRLPIFVKARGLTLPGNIDTRLSVSFDQLNMGKDAAASHRPGAGKVLDPATIKLRISRSACASPPSASASNARAGRRGQPLPERIAGDKSSLRRSWPGLSDPLVVPFASDRQNRSARPRKGPNQSLMPTRSVHGHPIIPTAIGDETSAPKCARDVVRLLRWS